MRALIRRELGILSRKWMEFQEFFLEELGIVAQKAQGRVPAAGQPLPLPGPTSQAPHGMGSPALPPLSI